VKALTVHQPFAHAIVAGFKNVENRTWRPSRLGLRILIHAGKGTPSPDALAAVDMDDDVDHLPRGAVVGSAVLSGWFDAHEWRMDGGLSSGTTKGAWGAWGEFWVDALRSSPWYTGRIGWWLTSARVYSRPVPCRGLQGLWVPDSEVLARCHDEEAKHDEARRSER